MTDKLCSATECLRSHYARGWCKVHYQRWRKHGDAMLDRPVHNTNEIRARRYDEVELNETDCVEAPGTGKRYRSGSVKIGPEKEYSILQHRAAYAYHFGPIPKNVIVRHKCDNPPCVNPYHLEIGTYSDNVRDCIERGRSRNQFSDRTHCKNGHLLGGDNVYPSIAARGGRDCKTCDLERKRLYRQRKKADHE